LYNNILTEMEKFPAVRNILYDSQDENGGCIMGKSSIWKHYVSSIMLMGIFFAVLLALPVHAQGLENAKRFTADNQFVVKDGIITGYTGSDKEVVIPAKIGSVSVRGLAGTFFNNTTVERVILPDTITTIGDDTFNGCSRLNSVFVYDPACEKDAAALVADNPYYFDGSKYIVTADNMKAYEIISNGNGVVIPSGLVSLGQRVFNSCVFGNFYVMDGNNSFKVWNDPANPASDDGKIGPCLISADSRYLYRFAPGYHQAGGSTYLLPPVTVICDYALESVSKNGGFEIPNTVVTIGNYAFYKAGNTTYVNFQNVSKVTTIGSFAFAYINNLGNGGTFTLPASVTKVGEYCFAYCQNIQIDISKSSIVSVPAFIFKDSNNLHSITLPATVKTIEAYAFYECDNFNNIYFLGDSLEKIGTAAFKGCNNLHEIKIPEGVTAIENDTFSGCQNLNVIELPDSLTTIGDNAFEDCQNIHKMVIPENVTYISNTTFNGVEPEKLTGVDTTKNTYAQTRIKKPLPKKGTSVKVGKLVYKVTKSDATKGTVTVVKAKDKKQKSISIPATVNINGYNFKVTSIANKAFKKNKKLTSIIIGKNVKTIGKEAFYGCTKLKKITVKSKVVSKVNKNAFKNIHKKAKIKLPKMSSKKYKKYKKKFAKKGQAKTVKITK
jgi:hypothetical protein